MYVLIFFFLTYPANQQVSFPQAKPDSVIIEYTSKKSCEEGLEYYKKKYPYYKSQSGCYTK